MLSRSKMPVLSYDWQRRRDGCKHCLITQLHSGDPLVAKALRMLVPRPNRAVRAA